MQLIINEIADSDSLPRIHSHKKINSRLPLSSRAKNTEEDTIQPAPVRQRSVSALQSNRKALHSANTSNTSKAVRLEVTTAAFQKKIEQLERQEAMLNKEIEAANAEIIKFRLKKKGAQESVSTSSSRASSAVAEDGRGRLEALRRRLDRERERARKIMNQVDKVRRDIQTTKKLNDQITQQLKSYESQLNSLTALAQELEETLAFKNAEAQKKKIEMVHQKARIIKEYDAILHKLDTQLNTQQTSKPTVAGFYLTDVALGEQRQRKRSLVLVQNSPKGHRAGNRIEYFREKMEEWRGQAEAIKGKVNAQSLQEVEEKLMEMHQNTYHYYKFINERRAVLEELQSRNTQLKQQKLCLSEEITKKEHSRSSQAITTTKHNINKCFTAQAELKAKITECSQIYQKTRSFVCQLLHESGLQLPVQQGNIPIEQQINEATLATFLQSLLQMKQFGPNGLKYSHSL